MDPISQILLFLFDREFKFAPQQSMSRFASRCKQEVMTAENRFSPIIPSVDGLDYDPDQQNLKFRPLPMLQFSITRVGFQRYSHTWNYAIATEDLGRIQPEFRMQLPRLARMSWERFKDRILAGRADGDRVTTNDADFSALTKTSLPAANRYAIQSATGLTTLTEDHLIDMAIRFASREVRDPMTGTMSIPTLACSHAQILGLLKRDKVVSRDYVGNLLPLIRGDINEYMGFEFIRIPTIKRITNASGVYFKNNDPEVKLGASAGFAQQAAEKLVVSHPQQGFGCGLYEGANYMHVWQNPTRGGAFEFLYKNTIGYKRIQNEYVMVAYGKDEQSAVGAPLPKKAPTKGATYHDNSDGGAIWDYANVA